MSTKIRNNIPCQKPSAQSSDTAGFQAINCACVTKHAFSTDVHESPAIAGAVSTWDRRESLDGQRQPTLHRIPLVTVRRLTWEYGICWSWASSRRAGFCRRRAHVIGGTDAIAISWPAEVRKSAPLSVPIPVGHIYLTTAQSNPHRRQDCKSKIVQSPTRTRPVLSGMSIQQSHRHTQCNLQLLHPKKT